MRTLGDQIPKECAHEYINSFYLHVRGMAMTGMMVMMGPMMVMTALFLTGPRSQQVNKELGDLI